MSLLVVGSVALDTVRTPKGEIADGLGGSATYFSVSASLFTKVCLVGIVGSDFPREHINKLASRGIDLEGLCTMNGKTFRWCGRYDESFSDPETLDTQLNVYADFSPILPEKYRTIPYVFLGNIHPDLQLRVLNQMENPKLVAIDTMNMWIEREKASLLKVLRRIDMAVINELELRLLTGLRSTLAGARKLQTLGPRIVIIKRGAYGAMMLYGDDIFMVPGYPIDEVLDPTGAGDSFAGGIMGFIANTDDICFNSLKMAVVHGTIMGSFCVEGFSIHKLEEVSPDAVSHRIERLRSIIKF